MIDVESHDVSCLEHERASIAPVVTSQPLVSIVMIFFNAVKFLDEAIQSVFAQVYDNWELLLVDDGSTDGGTQIARQYAARYPEKIRYLEHTGHENRGMSASRNLGIYHARGQYIALLDADDVWLRNKLQYQVEILNRYPEVGLVVGPIEWWYSWSGKSEDRGRDFVAPFPPELRSDSLIEPPEMLIALIRKATVSTTSSLIRRGIIERAGGFEENFRGMFEDQAFAAKVYLTNRVFVAGDCHYRWRKHPDSCCAIAVESDLYEQARGEFLTWLKDYLARHAFKHSVLNSVLETELHKSRMNQASRTVGHSQFKLLRITKAVLRCGLPETIRERAYNWRHGVPPVGKGQFGHMRRLTPFSRVWGFDRGLPVDRYYIEKFLAMNSGDIEGSVLEFGDGSYTQKFGGSRVVRSEVLYPVEGNPRATIVADLTQAENIPSEQFDCIICTQTLMFIFDVHSAMRTLYRILKPGGVLLLTGAGVSHQISREDMEKWGDYWRFTSLSIRRLCQIVFPPSQITVEAHGNVFVAIAFLHGLASEELRQEELDAKDPDYEVLITVRAVKPPISA
jgi:glycosyltransferase involved in cell wall biosynthesis